jgi:hypothetical protein
VAPLAALGLSARTGIPATGVQGSRRSWPTAIRVVGGSTDRLEKRGQALWLGDGFLQRYGPEPGQSAMLSDANRARRHAEFVSGLFRGHSGKHPEN